MNAGSGPVDCKNNFQNFLYNQKLQTCHVCLSTSAVVGLSYHSQMGLISLLSLLVLLSVIARNYRRNVINLPDGEWRLFRGNVDILVLNLIVADVVMSLGAISDIYWAHHQQVFCGSYCDAQGVLQTVGETAAALSTLAVAVYTWLAIYPNRRPPYRPWCCLAVVVLIWLWVLLWAIIPLGLHHSDKDLDSEGNVTRYYTPTPWWCWVNGKYLTHKIISEYLWLWVAGAGNIALYVPAYLILRKQQRKNRPENRPTGEGRPEFDERSIESEIYESNEAIKLLCYPLAYTFCVLPLSIIRWAGFVHPELLTHPHILAPSMVFGSIFDLMGLINTLLTWWARPAILLIGSDGRLDPSDPRIDS
ncbi:hypothetical protein BDV93DRAFT_553148 [Ceratobasidium sp. AG-I]|nr:hypothetical protein BDV93DRAFT_553148 [Ceratobasidium sp. AG-I]